MRSLRSLPLVLCLAACQPVPEDEPGSVGSATSAAGVKGSYLVYSTFNGAAANSAPPTPWKTQVSAKGSVSLAGLPFPADLSVRIAKPDAQGTDALTTSFAGVESGRIVFEAKVMAAETAGYKAIPYIYDQAGNAVASVAFQDGSIVTHVGAASATVMPFSANVWYRVRVLVDTKASTFDLYVDGVRVQHAAALRTPSAALAKVSYFMDGANTGTLYVDNVRIYDEAVFIGAPPSPVFDVRKYGATGDGKALDTAAIQSAIDKAAGTGGSVLLSGGTYLSGTLTLKSKMTFFVDSSAVLLGSTKEADFPAQAPSTGNTQLSNTQRALLYVPAASDVTIDGGGVIDGQGDAYSSSAKESTRPMLVWAALSQDFTVENLYLRKGAVWSLVSMETDHVLVSNVNLQSNGITHDGIDIVDGTDITVQWSAVNAGDDAMCIKSGVRRGIDTMEVKDSVFTGNAGGSNGIKIGTATYGAFDNISIHDVWVKDVQYAAMAVESRDGADVDGVVFQRVGFDNVGAAFFVYLAQQATTHPIGDVPKLGSIENVSFTDIDGATASWTHSPHQGSLVTGQIYEGKTYAISNLTFDRVSVAFDGGSTVTPASPPEATPGEYPESNMFGDLPAWAFYLRHVSNVKFEDCSTSSAKADVRDALVTDDASGVSGVP